MIHSLRNILTIGAITLIVLLSSAKADPIVASFSGDFQNPIVVVGDGITGNGGIFSTFGDTVLSLSFLGAEVSPDGPGQSFVAGVLSVDATPLPYGDNFTLQLQLTTNAEDPNYQGPAFINIQIAVGDTRDYLGFPDHPEFGTYEISNNGTGDSIELMAQFGSIDFLGFGNVVGGNGRVIPETTPEPATISLVMLAGLGAVAARRKFAA